MPVILLTVIVIVCKVLLDLFLSTGYGLAMRAAGANPRMARANGINVDRMVYLGLAIANALTALSGALFAQMLGAADVSMGIGVIVVALAAVIGGTALMPLARGRAGDAGLCPGLDSVSCCHRSCAQFERDRVHRLRRQPGYLRCSW